jgi:hypothetical protein
MFALQQWYGFFVNQNKFTNKSKPVYHKRQWIVLDGHDQGMLIPDVTIPFVNVYYAIMWPLSSRKILFSASTVKMNGTATGCTQLIGLPPLPMMTCGNPISAPTAFSMINFTNTVVVGMTLGDLLIGLLSAAISMALDYVFYKLKPPSAMNTTGLGIGKQFFQKALPFLEMSAKNGAISFAKYGAMKWGLSALGNFAISALKGNPTFKLGVGLPFLGGGVQIAPPSNSNPNWVTAQGNVLGWQGATSGSTSSWGTPQSSHGGSGGGGHGGGGHP